MAIGGGSVLTANTTVHSIRTTGQLAVVVAVVASSAAAAAAVVAARQCGPMASEKVAVAVAVELRLSLICPHLCLARPSVPGLPSKR